ncbi:2'-5' RNA ligase family protein [Photobacterium sp. Alg240-V54]|uniref:2'-5' RNA ligase family protein n=1 Tax=Photobacterium sp. Alg240-V54 TaxID=2305995 RepID=UPI0013CF4078|nr:2'-5' RNA ligase family protein [Photobacterium sp. Alg240-V54]
MLKKCMLTLALISISQVALASPSPASITSYNLFLIPSHNVDKTVSAISSQLKQQQLSSLYSQGYLPHITLYLSQYSTSNLKLLKQQAQQLASQWHQFPLTLEHIERTKGDWLMLEISNTRELQRLADTAAITVSPLRTMDQKAPAWVSHYPEKLAAFQRYGSPNVFTNFDPHITLLAQSDPQKLTQFMTNYGQKFQQLKFDALGIGIAAVNSNGQAKAVIARYPFTK